MGTQISEAYLKAVHKHNICEHLFIHKPNHTHKWHCVHCNAQVKRKPRMRFIRKGVVE